MPKTLSTPLLLKALSKKQTAESLETQQPTVLSTADLTLHMTRAQEKHVNRLKLARRKKYLDEKGKELPELTEGVYRKIYAPKLGDGGLPSQDALQQHERRDVHEEEQDDSAYDTALDKENLQQSGNRQHIQQLSSTKSWPQTPVPRKQIPTREIRKHIQVKPIMKEPHVTTSRPTPQSMQEHQLPQPNIQFSAPSHEEDATPNDVQLDLEYQTVMKTIEEEERRKLAPEDVESTPKPAKRPTLGVVNSQHQAPSGASPHSADDQSDSSDTPSMKRLYSHIDDMKKYLDDLSEPEVLDAHMKNVNSSPDAQARTQIPVSASMPSPIAQGLERRRSSKHAQDQSASLFSTSTKQQFYSPMDPNILAAEEDTLSNPSLTDADDPRKVHGPEHLTNNIRAPLRIRGRLTHDEKVQVPTPTGTESFPFSAPPSSPPAISPQELLEYEAPETLQEFNFNLEMPEYSSLRRDPYLTQTASDINMESLTLSDVTTHISSVCDHLQSQFYLPFVEESARREAQSGLDSTLLGSRIPGQYSGTDASKPHFTAAQRAASKPRHSALRPHHENYALWNLFSAQVNQLRRRRIHEISTIQQRIIDQFFTDNQSLFQKLDHIREQIRKEQALAVRVQLRTTRAHALRLKKNNPEKFAAAKGSDVTTPTIRATIRSSQSSYNITMYENQVAELVARIFLRYLRFLTTLKKEREHALLVVDTEEYEYTGRNVLTIWKQYVSQYRGESARIRHVTQRHNELLLRQCVQQWRQKLEHKLETKHRKATADQFALKRLMRKAFVSMKFAHTRLALEALQEQIAVRYALSMRLLKCFFAWRSVARRGDILKEKLMNLAFSKQEDNELLDEAQENEYTSMKIRVQQYLLKDLFEQHDNLKAEYRQLERMQRLELAQDATQAPASLSHLRQTLDRQPSPHRYQISSPSSFMDRAIAVEEGSPYIPRSPLEDELLDNPVQLNRVQQLRRDIVGIQSEIAIRRNLADSASTLPSRRQIALQIQTSETDDETTLENIAHHSYNIKLLRKMFEKWRDEYRMRELEHEAQEMYEYRIKKKMLLQWYHNAQLQREEHEKADSFYHHISLVRYFQSWKRRTERLLELKDTIADHCADHHTLRRTFQAWRRQATISRELREREQIFTEHRNLIVLRQYFDAWCLATKQGQIKDQMNDIADRHSRFILLQRTVQQWREESRRRQLLRRVFTRALKGYRSQTHLPETLQNEALHKKIFRAWREQTRSSACVQERRVHHKIAKHWHNKTLKTRMFRKWKNILDTNSKADAFYFSILLRRTKTLFRHWHDLTIRRSEHAQEEVIIRQICDRLLVKRLFYRWKRVVDQKEPPREHLSIKTMRVPTEDSQLSPAASTRPASSTDELSPFDDDLSFEPRSVQEYRNAHEEMKRNMRERLATMSKEFKQELSIAQIYYNKQLRAKAFRAWYTSILLKKEQHVLQDRADHFYNRKLQKTRFNNTAISTERLEQNFRENKLPPFFEPTYRIVNYRLLLKVVQAWKDHVREQKIVRKGVAIAARYHRRNLMVKTFRRWRRKMKLMNENDVLRPTRGPLPRYSSASTTTQGSDEVGAPIISPLYRPASVGVSAVEVSLDGKLFGNPRRPYSLMPHRYGDSPPLYVSPRI